MISMIATNSLYEFRSIFPTDFPRYDSRVLLFLIWILLFMFVDSLNSTIIYRKKNWIIFNLSDEEFSPIFLLDARRSFYETHMKAERKSEIFNKLATF